MKKKDARKKSRTTQKSTLTARKKLRQEKFLELFPQLWTITRTAKAIGVTRWAASKWLEDDPDFSRRVHEEAIPAVADALEEDASQKILHGIERPAAFYGGEPVMKPLIDPKTGAPKRDRKGEVIKEPVMIREFPTALHTLKDRKNHNLSRAADPYFPSFGGFTTRSSAYATLAEV